MLRSATRSPSTSRANGSLPDHALGQVAAPHLHGDLVRGAFLPAATLRLPRHDQRPHFARTLQADGAAPLLGDHDPGRGAHHRLRPVAVARLVPSARAAGCTPRSRWSRCSLAITYGAGSCCATSRLSATPGASAGSAGSTSFPRSCCSPRCSWLSSSPSSEFFATAPRGLEALLQKEIASLGACQPAGGPRRGRLRWRLGSCATARTSGRASPRASCGRCIPFPMPTRRMSTRKRKAVDWPQVVRSGANAARQRHRAEKPAEEPGVRHAAHQGCGMRPVSRHGRAASGRRSLESGRARARLPREGQRHALPRHLGRAAFQARLARRAGRGAAAREPGRGHRHAHGLATGRAAARSDVRRRHAAGRGGGDGARPRPGREAQLRLREAEELPVCPLGKAEAREARGKRRPGAVRQRQRPARAGGRAAQPRPPPASSAG